MPDLVLLTYADGLYAEAQERLLDRASDLGVFAEILGLAPDDLEASFCRRNRVILNKFQGAGFCLWKPYLILRTLLSLKPGDALLYVDAGDWLEGSGPALRARVFELLDHEDVYLTAGSFRNADWTKRDTFVYMDCDNHNYHDAIQVEAGVIAVKNTPTAYRFLVEWLHWCMDPRILTSDPNVIGMDNLPGFSEHRYDQSVLTNLAVKYGVTRGNALREFVHCNRNLP